MIYPREVGRYVELKVVIKYKCKWTDQIKEKSANITYSDVTDEGNLWPKNLKGSDLTTYEARKKATVDKLIRKIKKECCE